MSEVYNMTQCRLQRITDFAMDVAWIPSKYAVIGNYIRLDEDGDTYKILETWTTLPSDKVLERSQDYKRTRKASDI